MEWQHFYKIVYHPNPGHYYVHSVQYHIPVSSYFLDKKEAEEWAKAYMDKQFEEVLLES